jgi:hypothetical protein
MFESALTDEARAEIARIGQADIVIGVLSYRNARTVATVATTAASGALRCFPRKRLVLVNVDSGSSDGTPAAFMKAKMPEDVYRFTTGYVGLTGHGSAARAVFEVAAQVGAQACLLLDAGNPAVREEHVCAAFAALLERNRHLVVPLHEWSYVDATLEDVLFYPLIRLMYGSLVRRPLGGDWCLSGKLAWALSEQDVWETDAARGGFDVWLIVTALANKVPLCQAPASPRRRQLQLGTTAFDQRFVHSVSELLRHLGSHQRLWRSITTAQEVETIGHVPAVLPPVEPEPSAQFWQAFLQGLRTWRRILRRVLDPADLASLYSLAEAQPESLSFDEGLWARIVLASGICFNKAELDPDKVAAALSCPFYARAVALWNAVRSIGLDAYEELIERQAQAFEAHRQYLLDRWDSFVAWTQDAPIR